MSLVLTLDLVYAGPCERVCRKRKNPCRNLCFYTKSLSLEDFFLTNPMKDAYKNNVDSLDSKNATKSKSWDSLCLYKLKILTCMPVEAGRSML